MNVKEGRNQKVKQRSEQLLRTIFYSEHPDKWEVAATVAQRKTPRVIKSIWCAGQDFHLYLWRTHFGTRKQLWTQVFNKWSRNSVG